jgi:hypothetical protein
MGPGTTLPTNLLQRDRLLSQRGIGAAGHFGGRIFRPRSGRLAIVLPNGAGPP